MYIYLSLFMNTLFYKRIRGITGEWFGGLLCPRLVCFEMPTRMSCWYLFVLQLTCALTVAVFISMMCDYNTMRNSIIDKEKQFAVGGDIKLTALEKTLNEKLLKLKYKELYADNNRPWTRNFIDVVSEIENSEVFKFIKKLPKGGSLHSHLFASASSEYVISNLLQRENLYVCNINGRRKLKFLPVDNTELECELLANKRNSDLFNDSSTKYLTLNSSDNNIWDSFKKIFTFSYDLFSYIGVFEDYVYQVLMEHYLDNVMYMEIRSPFVPLYDLNGTTYQPIDFIDSLWRTVNKFKDKYTDFIGMKLIYAQYRGTDTKTVKENFEILKEIIKKYPNFIAGIDFVGFEEDGVLLNYYDELKNMDGINFYFHAGETKYQGAPVDLNIVDAILLDCKRIGHGYALPKHPELMKMVMEKNIAVEVCPISNQVLGLVADLRNHPASYLIANGYPIVVCNDDPGNWGARGLSFDWYLVFMAMTNQDSGLEFLKKIAMNSFQYSALNDEKYTATELWRKKWNQFVEDLNINWV